MMMNSNYKQAFVIEQTNLNQQVEELKKCFKEIYDALDEFSHPRDTCYPYGIGDISIECDVLEKIYKICLQSVAFVHQYNHLYFPSCESTIKSPYPSNHCDINQVFQIIKTLAEIVENNRKTTYDYGLKCREQISEIFYKAFIKILFQIEELNGGNPTELLIKFLKDKYTIIHQKSLFDPYYPKIDDQNDDAIISKLVECLRQIKKFLENKSYNTRDTYQGFKNFINHYDRFFLGYSATIYIHDLIELKKTYLLATFDNFHGLYAPIQEIINNIFNDNKHFLSHVIDELFTRLLKRIEKFLTGKKNPTRLFLLENVKTAFCGDFYFTKESSKKFMATYNKISEANESLENIVTGLETVVGIPDYQTKSDVMFYAKNLIEQARKLFLHNQDCFNRALVTRFNNLSLKFVVF